MTLSELIKFELGIFSILQEFLLIKKIKTLKIKISSFNKNNTSYHAMKYTFYFDHATKTC